MLLFNNYGVRVYATSLPDTPTGRGPARRVAEGAAIKRLLREAFPEGKRPRIGHYSSGAPFLSDPDTDGNTPPTPLGGPWPSISISHCAAMVALATGPAGHNIGIDCETGNRRRQLSQIASRFLSPTQMEAWSQWPMSLWAWTIKEALYKAAGIPGLNLADIPLPHEIPVGNPTPDSTVLLPVPAGSPSPPAVNATSTSSGTPSATRRYSILQIDSCSIPAMLTLALPYDCVAN